VIDLSRARGVPATGEPGRAGSFIHRLARGGDVISGVTRRQGRATENQTIPYLAAGDYPVEHLEAQGLSPGRFLRNDVER